MRKVVAIFLLLVILAYGAHAVKVSMSVPAVVLLGGGELVTLEIEILPGNGNAFVSTSPFVGIQTQNSARTAFEVAADVANAPLNNYDVFVTFENVGGAKSVDGPSGGAAMSLLMLSTLQNKTIRRDFSITGTIENDGGIGAVGEVAKKAKASLDAGIRIFLIPKSYDITDKMILTILSRRWNLSIIEVSDIKDAASIAFSDENKSFQTSVYELPARRKISVAKIELECKTCYLEEFRMLGSMMVNESYSLLDELRSQNKTEFVAFINFIKNDLDDSNELIEKDYLYSGANNAFLARLNINFLSNSNMTDDGLSDYLSSLDACIKNVKKSRMNRNNLEWVIGGEQRLAWAKNKLKNVLEISNVSKDEEEVLLIFKEALLAESWCKVSNEMFKIGDGIEGDFVDEVRLKDLSAEKLSEVEFIENNFDIGDLGDAAERINSARMLHEEGNYGGAILDADYVISAAKAVNKSRSEGIEEIAGEIENLRLSNISMWSFVYGAHSKFLYEQASGGSGLEGSLRLGIYAKDIDSDVLAIDGIFEKPEEMGPASVGFAGQRNKDELILVLAFSLFIALVMNIAQIYANKANKRRIR